MTFSIRIQRGVTELKVTHLNPERFCDDELRLKIHKMRETVAAMDSAQSDCVTIEMDDYDERLKHVSASIWEPMTERMTVSPKEIVDSLARSLAKALIK